MNSIGHPEPTCLVSTSSLGFKGFGAGGSLVFSISTLHAHLSSDRSAESYLYRERPGRYHLLLLSGFYLLSRFLPPSA